MISSLGFSPLKSIALKGLMRIAPQRRESEDCLTLSVRTPTLEASARLPVMVWIHGGGYVDGSGCDPMYRGHAIPAQGVVYVSLNYRLGVLGFLAHPELSEESEQGVSGNYGLLDQIHALKWVQKNISAFGGDPGNVTIFGESGGGDAVLRLMCSPLAAGLFHKAASQSPGTYHEIKFLRKDDGSRKSGESVGVNFARHCGVQCGVSKRGAIEELRSLPVHEIQRKVHEFDESEREFNPLIDGVVLPKSVLAAFHSGEQATVPLIIGSNADEETLTYPFVRAPIFDYRFNPPPPGEYAAFLDREFGSDKAELVRYYPGIDSGSPAASARVFRDSFYGAKSFFLAKAASSTNQVFFYRFERQPSNKNQTAKAFHGADITFVHGTPSFVFPMNEEDKALSAAMTSYWCNFAKTGNPNGQGLQPWSTFDATTPTWLRLNHAISESNVDKTGAYDIFCRRLLRAVGEPGSVEQGPAHQSL